MSSLGVIVLCAVLTSTAPAAETVRLGLGDCVPSRDLVHDLVGIEIGFERLIDRGEAAFEVRVECGVSDVSIALYPASRDVPPRRIAKIEVEKSDGARLVALNIVELLNVASRVAASPDVVSEPPKEILPERSVIEPLKPSASMRKRFAVAPTLRYAPSPDRIAYGARASFALEAPKDAGFVWTAQLGAGFEQSNTPVAFGEIRSRVSLISLAVGERIELTEDLSIFGVVGAIGGYVTLEGRSTTEEEGVIAKSGSGVWFGPMLAARVRYGARAGLSLGVEAGLITKEVYGELAGGDRIGQRGAWLGVDVALDWSVGER